MVAAIHAGYPQRQITESADRYQQAVERYDPGKAAAATVVMLALLLALTALSLRRMEHNIEGRE